MPRLLILAPCDNVLINRQAESASLIVLFTEIKVVAPPADTPEGSAAPLRWFIFSQWEMLSEDVGETFEQDTRLVNEQGKELLAVQQEFTGEPGKFHHRMVAMLPGFPVTGGAGRYRITLNLRKKGSETWEEKGSYPLSVTHVTEPFLPFL